MAQTLEYKKIPPKEKEKLSRRLAALLYLHRQVKIWAENKCSTEQVIRWCKENNPLCNDVMAEWLRWKGYSPGRKMDIGECWMTWYRLEFREIFDSFSSCCCCPESVKDASRIYLNAVKQLYWETGLNDPDESCRLTRNDWEKLEFATTALFFREWMQSQPQMRQSIHDFARVPFGNPISEDRLLITDENGISDYERRYRSLNNAHNEIGIMLEMGQIQKERETYRRSQYEEKTKNGYVI